MLQVAVPGRHMGGRRVRIPVHQLSGVHAMPVNIYYHAVCQNCDLECFKSGETYHGAVAEAQGIGWSAYPILCEGCNSALKERLSREPKDGGTVRDSGEGPERARRGW